MTTTTTKLTRDDVEYVTTDAPGSTPSAPVWGIRLQGQNYRINNGQDEHGHTLVCVVPADDRFWRTMGSDADDCRTATAVYCDFPADDGRRWDAIDRLLAWMSLDVEDGWSRPLSGRSKRLGMADPEMVVLFTATGHKYTRLWSVEELADHFQSWLYEDDPDYDAGDHHPSAVYIREDDDLVRVELQHGVDTGHRSFEVVRGIDGEVLAEVRYA